MAGYDTFSLLAAPVESCSVLSFLSCLTLYIETLQTCVVYHSGLNFYFLAPHPQIRVLSISILPASPRPAPAVRGESVFRWWGGYSCFALCNPETILTISVFIFFCPIFCQLNQSTKYVSAEPNCFFVFLFFYLLNKSKAEKVLWQ